jgi:radical SAM protein with 4Fe4S-binding SPASM domain
MATLPPQADGDRFADKPLLVFWELTRACALACSHCRATAQHRRDPNELLPQVCGNIRELTPKTIYREHPLFISLRDSNALGGKCGRCEFRDICGGSRARAYGLTGDPFAEDPACPYQPLALRKH